MVRSKKKNKQTGVDFLKVKRKVGKRLPPPRNETNVQIKSKAIILPEQSLALEKEGLAINRKRQTLKELLMQTTHHNVNVRKDALLGIKDLLIRHPRELKLHKLAIIEKLSPRMSDVDKGVRETLFFLLKSIIFPGLEEAVMGPLISIVMAHIFNAMTQLAIDIRLTSFKFLDLVVDHYKSIAVTDYVSKVLQLYAEMLGKPANFLQDRRKLLDVITSLIDYLSCLHSNIQQTSLQSTQKKNDSNALHGYKVKVPRMFSTLQVFNVDENGNNDLFGYLQMLFPVCLEVWAECVSEVCSMHAIDSLSLECMLSILDGMNLICKCLRSIQVYTREEQSSFSECGKYPSGLNMQKLIKHIMPSIQQQIIAIVPVSPLLQSSHKIQDQFMLLNIKIFAISFETMHWVDLDISAFEKILQLIESSLCGQMLPGCRRKFSENLLSSIIPLVPRFFLHASRDWKYRLLKAFTEAFEHSAAKQVLQTSFLLAIEEMVFVGTEENLVQDFQTRWIQLFPKLLWEFKDEKPDSSKLVLQVLHKIGHCASATSALHLEYAKLQQMLVPFFSLQLATGNRKERVIYGPFIRLPKECQELAIDCLYYFSNLTPTLLESLVRCCHYHDLDLSLVTRIIHVMHASFCSGHIKIADHLSFLLSLLVCFSDTRSSDHSGAPSPDNKIGDPCLQLDRQKVITRLVCCCLSAIGNEENVMETLKPTILDELACKQSLAVKCSLLRLIVVLSSKCMTLPVDVVYDLPQHLASYLVQIAQDQMMSSDINQGSTASKYFVLPCVYLLSRSRELTTSLFKFLESLSLKESESHSKHARHLCSLLWVAEQIYKTEKLHQKLVACEPSTRKIINIVKEFQASHTMKLSIKAREALRNFYTQLNVIASVVHKWTPGRVAEEQ